MSREYIPVATSSTVYYKPETQQEFEEMTALMKVGDMIFSKWVFRASGGMWYTMGLNDKADLTTMCLFPNIILSETPLKSLTRWGMARMDYLKTHQPFVAAQFGMVGLHKHCLEIEEQAEERKRNMMTAIRKDPKNRVTERDKAADPMAWVGRMNNYQASVHEIIYAELIYG
ncbi:MAG: TnpV protein [Defluviitaleaceae bacterium]|nr:TnpV protein [Defluviitaleaceae bacterium]MCL2190341.1 TnpV protein [Defluviitaleaceae bacterium]